MARGRFCARCGFTFTNETANFCIKCQMARDDYEGEEEATNNTILDFRGPLHVESENANPNIKAPSYNTIFNPPPLKNRRSNKTYGKLSLRTNWAIQHSNLKSNYKEVKKWITNGQDRGVLPHGTFNLADIGIREALNKIIDENINELQELKFQGRGEPYKWAKNNIYKHIRKHLKYQRQKERRLERRRGEAPESSDAGECRGTTEQSDLEPPLLLEGFVGEDDVEEDNESFVLKEMNLCDIDEMYAELQTLMIERNIVESPKPFPRTREIREMDVRSRLELVAAYFRARRHHSDMVHRGGCGEDGALGAAAADR